MSIYIYIYMLRPPGTQGCTCLSYVFRCWTRSGIKEGGRPCGHDFLVQQRRKNQTSMVNNTAHYKILQKRSHSLTLGQRWLDYGQAQNLTKQNSEEQVLCCQLFGWFGFPVWVGTPSASWCVGIILPKNNENKSRCSVVIRREKKPKTSRGGFVCYSDNANKLCQ